MKKVILGLILLMILGIIPTLLVILMEKSIVFSILVGILSIILLAKNLCK